MVTDNFLGADIGQWNDFEINTTLSQGFICEWNAPDAAPSQYKQPSTQPDGSLVADPVDPSIGAHRLQRSFLPLNGATSFSFDLHYDSTQLTEGQMGRGWYNNYEVKIKAHDSGSQLYYYITPSNYIPFQLNANCTAYTCTTMGKQTWTITLNDDRYILHFGDDSQDTFDLNGKLTDIQDKTGKKL